MADVRSDFPDTDAVATQPEIRVPLWILVNEEAILYSASVYRPWLLDDIVGRDELGVVGAFHEQLLWMTNVIL